VLAAVMMDVYTKNLKCDFEPLLGAIMHMVESESSSDENQTQGREKLRQYIEEAADLLNAYQGPLEEEVRSVAGNAQSVEQQGSNPPAARNDGQAHGPQEEVATDEAQREKIQFSKELKIAIMK
jgi:hypothetical protein